ncbi:Sterol O-acyltransferase 2 (Sterol-ester synthase 2) [Sorochytrium milnesiophthora]
MSTAVMSDAAELRRRLVEPTAISSADTSQESIPAVLAKAAFEGSQANVATMQAAAAIQKSRKGSPFKPRSSRLDLEKMERENDEFRGFFVLFWICMSVYVVLTLVRNVQNEGVLIGMRTFRIMSSDAVALFLSDMAMLLSLFSAYAINKLIVLGVIRRRYVGLVLQHVAQTAFIGFWLYWDVSRNWAWVQTSAFTLHTIAMLFKMHSYNEYNGELSLRLEEYEGLQKKLAAMTSASNDTNDGAIKAVKARLEELNRELCPHGSRRYPDNVTLANFADYLLCPTLVYEVEYPRTAKVRVVYIVEKAIATFGIMALMYIFVEHYIVPVLADIRNTTFLACLLQLLFPFMAVYLLGFFMVFDCICNGFAEITRFADRQFYDDWWNSSSFDQFARKWNKPVHEFLLRHVYLESINTYKFSKSNATYLTFFFSSCLHELAMIIVSRRVRFYLFVLQMFQLPLIWLGRQPWSRRHRVAGNAFFWAGMLCGIPLLAICYCWEHYMYDS